MIPCSDCGSPATCPVCADGACERHCLSGGSGACLRAHEDWLSGGAGGLAGVTSAGPPANADELRANLRRAVAELVVANGLVRCAGCGGLEDPGDPHGHARA